MVAKDYSWKRGVLELMHYCAETGVVPDVTLPASHGHTRHVWPRTKVDSSS